MSKIPTHLLDKQIFMMTGAEILELFRVAYEPPTTTVDYTKKHFVYGLDGLAGLVGCGKTKAQKIKNSGVIDDAYTQVGKKLIFDAEKVLTLLKEHQDEL